jgi:hypothetical protein
MMLFESGVLFRQNVDIQKYAEEVRPHENNITAAGDIKINTSTIES